MCSLGINILQPYTLYESIPVTINHAARISLRISFLCSYLSPLSFANIQIYGNRNLTTLLSVARLQLTWHFFCVWIRLVTAVALLYVISEIWIILCYYCFNCCAKLSLWSLICVMHISFDFFAISCLAHDNQLVSFMYIHWFLPIQPKKKVSHSIAKFDWNLLAETRYKILPAYEGDKQQLQRFYNACCGMAQVTPQNFFLAHFFYSWYILKDHLDKSFFYFLK
jgi:hypothetical protein